MCDGNVNIAAIKGEQVQEAAKAWGQTIAGLATIGGVVTLLQGDATIASLNPVPQRWAVGVLIIALAMAIGAVINAFGVAWEDYTCTSYKRLNASIIATVGTVVLLVVAAFILWKGDRETTLQQYLVTFTDHTVACGPLGRDGEILMLSGRELADVATIEETAGCPSGA